MKSTGRKTSKARFWKKFLRLTRGRVGVIRALEVICLEERDPAFGKIIDTLKTSIESGATLTEALARHPSEFSISVMELVKTAEKTGAWDEILTEIAEGLEDGTFD